MLVRTDVVRAPVVPFDGEPGAGKRHSGKGEGEHVEKRAPQDGAAAANQGGKHTEVPPRVAVPYPFLRVVPPAAVAPSAGVATRSARGVARAGNAATLGTLCARLTPLLFAGVVLGEGGTVGAGAARRNAARRGRWAPLAS